MSEDEGTSTPKGATEPTNREPIPRVVVVMVLTSLIACCLVLFLFAGDAAEFFSAGGDIDKRVVLWGIRFTAGLVVIGALWRVIRIGYDYDWTGLGEAELPKQEDLEFRPRKTLWDWLQLLSTLAIPIALTGAGFWFAAQQEDREAKRAEDAQALEEQRADDAALQAYFDQMSKLMLEKDLRLSTGENATADNKEARTLARARTLTVLARVDPSRKIEIMRFLMEAGLVQSSQDREPVILLQGADLHGTAIEDVELSNANLSDTDLSGAHLYKADLSGANLSEANLSEAFLRESNLSNANLRGADLSGTSLNQADLSGANLSEAGISIIGMANSNLNGALAGADLRGANLSEANLSEAFLSDSNLSNANLRGADLSGAYLVQEEGEVRNLSGPGFVPYSLKPANLTGADLSGTNLSEALLTEVNGITNDELAQQAKTLEGATMPNGQKYEDWLKGRGEEGQTTAPEE